MRKHILYLLGIIFIIISFCLNFFSIWRLIMLLGGILIIDLNITFNYAKNVIILIFFPIMLFLLSFGLDWLLVNYKQRIPVFSFEIKSNNDIKTYNSFFYRVYDCQGKRVLDYGYQKDYACNPDSLESQDINAFLPAAVTNFSQYQHKFVKIEGKISKLSALNKMELSSYIIDEDNPLNGYVIFNTDYTLKVNTNLTLTDYRIYDEVTIIGLVSKLTNLDNKITIDLINTVIIPSTIYADYTVEVIENNRNNLENYVEKDNIFILGLDNIYFHYDEKHIYELNYLITDKRVILEDMLKNKTYSELKNQDEIIGNIYDFTDFKILKCENSKIIFSNKTRKFTSKICN